MTELTQPVEYTIDAKGRRLGRVATEAASLLLGKNRTDFARHTVAPAKVTITNAGQLDITERRGREIFDTYSGYPSGRRVETLAHLAERRGHKEVLRRSIRGMLPKNKLRPLLLKNLVIVD